MKNPNLNELSKRIDKLNVLKNRYKETYFEIDGIKQTLTAMLGRIKEIPKELGAFEADKDNIDEFGKGYDDACEDWENVLRNEIKKLIDKINNQSQDGAIGNDAQMISNDVYIAKHPDKINGDEK